MEIGRPAPRPLEIEVLNKFKRHEVAYNDERRKKYAQYIKDPPEVGAPGTGAVIWVGLNPDPCKAKYLAKCGIGTGPKKERPQSAPQGGKSKKSDPWEGMFFENLDDAQHARKATPMRPSSVPAGGGRSKEQRDPTSADWAAFCETAPGEASEHYNAWMQASKSGSCLLDDGQCSRPGTPARPPSRQATPAARPASVPTGARRAKGRKEPRDLASKSCISHFLEQKMKLPGVLPPATFTSLGAWPVRGAKKPDNIDELLYSGVSKGQEGRHAYLAARALIPPQKKNKTPATSSQEIAWEVHRGKPSMCLHPVKGLAAKCACPC